MAEAVPAALTLRPLSPLSFFGGRTALVPPGRAAAGYRSHRHSQSALPSQASAPVETAHSPEARAACRLSHTLEDDIGSPKAAPLFPRTSASGAKIRCGGMALICLPISVMTPAARASDGFRTRLCR